MECAHDGRNRLLSRYNLSCCLFLGLFTLYVSLKAAGGATRVEGMLASRSTDGPLIQMGSSNRHLLQNNGTGNVKVPLVVAEGGAQYLYPDMTMRAYEAAMDSGADFVTCMIATTSDGKAVCQPDKNLPEWTNIDAFPDLRMRQFLFKLRTRLYTFNFTLEEIKSLRVNHTTPEGRTKAFNGIYSMVTPEELIEKIKERAITHPSANRVGIVLEISDANEEMERLRILPSPLTYAKKLLKENNWTSPNAPAMVVSKTTAELKSFVEDGFLVPRLFRYLPKDSGSDSLEKEIPSGPDLNGTLTRIAESATGVIFHVDSVLSERDDDLWGKTIRRVAWDDTIFMAAKNANLSVYVWGFDVSDWSSPGPRFNTFLSDPLAMYRSLLYGKSPSLVAGIFTEFPATAAKAAVCYATPASLFPAKGLAKDRPFVVSAGAASLIPPHTNLSLLEAIRQGTDFVDCILQVSKDGVLFCLESMQLSKFTNVADRPEFKLRAKSRSYGLANGKVDDWFAFDFLWEEIETLKVRPSPERDNAVKNSPRLKLFNNVLPPVSLEEVINIAQNASREVGLFVKIDNPTYLMGMGLEKPDTPIDQIDLLLTTLRERGYLSSTNVYDESRRPLVIASVDSCGLSRMHTASNGTLQLVYRTGVRDVCEAITKGEANTTAWWFSPAGLQHMKSFAYGLSPTKRSILRVNNISAGISLDAVVDESGVDAVVSNAPASGLKVYGRAFRNDIAPGDGEGAYDYLADPTIELQYFFDHIQVQALDSQFPATASGYLGSSCRPRPGVNATGPRFNMTQLQPGALAKEIMALQSHPTVPITNSSTVPITNSSGDERPKKKDEWKRWTGVGFAFLVASVTMVLLAWFAIRRFQNRREERILKEEMKSFANIPMLKVFSYAELVTATNNFREANRLGKGGFGTVYRGELPDGSMIAVKKLHVDQRPTRSFRTDTSVRQLMNEVDIISSVQHRNVVPLEGLCTDREFLLVYDYMPHGSLQDALFDPKYGIKLDWKQWCHIAVGTAKGLAYLHEECEHKIIHRDIKPANILLDAHFNARVADFGLARNLHMDETHVTTKVMGSIGYMAPDYATSGQLTEKSDTYSYGVLLLTIITGQRPNSKARDQGEDMSTVEWVKKKARAGKDDLLTVVDPRFEGQFDASEAVCFLSTALLCAQNNPAMRPAMSDVVQMLLGKTELPTLSLAEDRYDFLVDSSVPFLLDTESMSVRGNATSSVRGNATSSIHFFVTTANMDDTNFSHSGIQEDSVILEGR